MDFTSYQMVSHHTTSLNTGSYLNQTEHAMFVNGYASDLWYGYSPNDVIEVSAWDRNYNFIGWNTFTQSNNYNQITLSFVNTLNFSSQYSYSELLTDFILYKNEKILVNPPSEVLSSFGILTGSYFLTYNFVRDMVGSNKDPLIIKDISPSRKELKIIPLTTASLYYDAFCQKKIILSDVSSLYLELTKKCPYNEIYTKVKSLYPHEINTIQSLFYLNTDGAMVTFFQNLYEDLIIYSSTTALANNEAIDNTNSLIRIQGIQTYFSNYLLSNSTTIVDFSDIDVRFNAIVSSSIERKFKPIGPHPSQEYVDAKAFLYDFFTKFYYQPISSTLTSAYQEKYYSLLKNGLNFGNNRLLSILSHDYIDERENPSDPLTLLVKLKEELPNDISIQGQCWVSNISLNPYVVSVIFNSPTSFTIHKIGPPNFSTELSNVSLTNINKSYTATDLQNTDEEERELTVSRNLEELNVDYTDFTNFVIFSSVEMRLKIFKNKMISLSSYSSSLQTLDLKNSSSLVASGSAYPFYTEEYAAVQSNITDIINTFDGYESYLYRNKSYEYFNGEFISASYVASQDTAAQEYDITNYDSLINNCPKHVLVDPDNDDYIIFLSMVGHFFDGLYVYIANLPSEKRVGHNATEEFTRRIVDYMMETFGWKLDDSLEEANLLNNYLSSDQVSSLNSMSAEERLKTVRNRLLINLPQIYKTKGTETAIKMLLSCYGIPSTLLSIREYGGVDYTNETSVYTNYERAYMYQWNTSSVYNYFKTGLSSGAKTITFKVSIDGSDDYTYDNEQILIGSVLDGVTTSSISGSGEWAIGFVRKPALNSGQFFFRIGYKGLESLKMYSPYVPLFDGEIYSVMLRRNPPIEYFDYTSNTDIIPCYYDLYVQRNNLGNQIVKVTSSIISSNESTNHRFNGSSSNLIIGGWFADYNGQGFAGTLDKLHVWYDPLSDNNFEDYVNAISSYSFSGSRPAHESLLFRMHTDYPMDLQQEVWKNANPFYSSGSNVKQFQYLGAEAPSNMDNLTAYNVWTGHQTYTYDTSSCNYTTQSSYPYQFKVIDCPCTHPTAKYGPNRFRNEKVKYISQSIAARFDDKGQSTYVPRNNVAPDSTQVGFFVDPQDFKNKDIIRYFGNYDFMDVIGNPSNRYDLIYTSLRDLRNSYATSKNEYSGSKTLFNELITLYKLYFNRSIFDSIKNLTPARTNTLVGVLIEPTILERSKYVAQPVFSETNTGSVAYYEDVVSHYSNDPSTKLMQMSMSLEWSEFGDFVTGSTGFNTSSLPSNRTGYLNLSYINLPNVIYPVNYGGNYIADISDKYQLGHLAGEI